MVELLTDYDEKDINESSYLINNSFHDFEDKNKRHKFIRKVYSIVSLQLLLTSLTTAFFIYYEPARKFIYTEAGQAVTWTSLIFLFVILLSLLCNPTLAKKKPVNYILLSLFTLFMSYLVAISASTYDTESVIYAFGITFFITVILTVYAWQTKYDFTTSGGILLSFLIGIIVASILNVFIHNKIFQIIIAALGAVIFSCYIVYDTQLIIGGKNHKMSFGEDDYILAAITLYLDIINLFLYLLELIGFKSSNA